MPIWFLIAVTAVYGLAMGSFLNVVIYRVPRGLSLVRPPSHCPACGIVIRWFDNVPLLAYLVLLGRCRHCRAAISPRYPLIEAATAALFVAVFLRFGGYADGAEGAWTNSVVLRTAVAVALVLLLVPLGVIDLEHHLLPDVLTLPGLILGLAGAAAGSLLFAADLSPLPSFADAVIGAALGGVVPYVVILLYRWLRGVEGMGLGDVKLLAMIGAFLGWKGMLLTLGLGSAAGAMVGIGLIAAKRGGRDTELPFGTFLCGATLVVLFWGEWIMRRLGWVPLQ
ncbi:MAG: prepilin peptidase [Acidobacteria bacterium]|nr:prepilin peptidase [Acidobacteriota bacterium]